jgi:hypothetical protein
MADLQTAAEIVLEHTTTEEPEPSDAELGANYRPSFPHSPDPSAQVFFGGELLRFSEAVTRERSQYIAMRRRAIQDAKERKENARLQQIERERQQQDFEAACERREARAALKVALAAYQEAREQTADFEVALAQAKAHQSAVRSGPDPGNDKFGRSLGAARDAVDAAQIRCERTTLLLEDGSKTLLQALSNARTEFAYLHQVARKERLQRAGEQLDGLLNKEALRHLKCSFEHLASAGQQVVALDQACGFRSGNYWWTDLKPQAQADGRVLPNASPSPTRLIQAATEVEQRFTELDQATVS